MGRENLEEIFVWGNEVNARQQLLLYWSSWLLGKATISISTWNLQLSVQISASKMTSIGTRQEQMKFQTGDKTMEGATQQPSEEKANYKWR